MSLLSIRWRKPTEIRDSVIRTLRPAVVTGFTDAPGSTQSATSADWIVDSRSSNKATVVASVVTTDSGDSHGGAIGRTGRRRDQTVAPPPNGLSSNFGALFLDHLSMVEATSVAQSARTMLRLRLRLCLRAPAAPEGGGTIDVGIDAILGSGAAESAGVEISDDPGCSTGDEVKELWWWCCCCSSWICFPIQ